MVATTRSGYSNAGLPQARVASSSPDLIVYWLRTVSNELDAHTAMSQIAFKVLELLHQKKLCRYSTGKVRTRHCDHPIKSLSELVMKLPPRVARRAKNLFGGRHAV